MSRIDKGVLLVGGPAAGECVRVPVGAYDWKVEVAPTQNHHLTPQAYNAAVQRFVYSISPFPIRLENGEPLFIGVMVGERSEGVAFLAGEYRRLAQENQRIAFQLKELTE